MARLVPIASGRVAVLADAFGEGELRIRKDSVSNDEMLGCALCPHHEGKVVYLSIGPACSWRQLVLDGEATGIAVGSAEGVGVVHTVRPGLERGIEIINKGNFGVSFGGFVPDPTFFVDFVFTTQGEGVKPLTAEQAEAISKTEGASIHLDCEIADERMSSTPTEGGKVTRRRVSLKSHKDCLGGGVGVKELIIDVHQGHRAVQQGDSEDFLAYTNVGFLHGHQLVARSVVNTIVGQHRQEE